MRTTTKASVLLMLACSGPALAAPPLYDIFDIGLVGSMDTASQGLRVSPNGIATGRSLGNPTRAFTWTESGGIVGLPNLASPSRPFSVGNAVTDAGIVVGTGATTAFGSSPLPLIWQGGTVSQLPLPMGQVSGRANDINAAGVAVGSVGSGSAEFGVIYAGGTATVVTQTTPGGCFLRTAFAINDNGLLCGFGIDPNNAARNVGFVLDTNTNTALDIDALPGLNGAIAFDVSDAGHVVGSSMLNQGSGLPFIWTAGGGMQPIPLPAGTTQGSARGVNSSGWVVGTASSAFAAPFLYDGSATYHLQDLLPPGSGWDLAMNTSSSALGISTSGIIVGTGLHNGAVRAYAMVPMDVVPVALEEFVALGRDDAVELRWRFSEASDAATVTVERAPAAAGPWQVIAPAIEARGRTMHALDVTAEIGVTYCYRLSVVDRGGETAILGLASGQRTVESSLRVVLGAPAPNPARTGTSIAYRIATAQDVELTVHDVSGRTVRTLMTGRAPAGDHREWWDGRSEGGTDVVAGVYFIRLRSAGGLRTQRVTIVR
jgi:uncharacterized membrane protein